MTRAKGSFDFLRRPFVVGIALRVDRTYLGGQLASGDGVTLDLIRISICQDECCSDVHLEVE